MDFVRLGAAYTTTYIPDQLIEGYNSLIWTERFQEFGEFELKSFDVDGLSAMLPPDTLVSHLETQDVMQVDTQEINIVGEGEDALPEITIRGRSASTIFDHRWVESKYQKKRRMRKKYSGTGALGVLMVNAVDNASGHDLTRGESDSAWEGAPAVNDYDWTTKGVIPNCAITEVVAAEGEGRWWQLEEGTLWPQMLKIMTAQDLGVRCLRPVSPSPATVITVATSLATRGTITRTNVADVFPLLRFEIYAGIDRSSTVQLSLLQGHLDQPTYLASNRDWKTVVEMMSGEISVSDVYRPGESAFTGWKHRTEGFDAGTPEIPDAPEKPDELRENATDAQRKQYRKDMEKWIDRNATWKNKRDQIIADFREESTKAAIRELYTKRPVDMFSGDVSSLSPYVYKTHYNLGDIVSLYGDYNKTAYMRVAEYVRTEDINGDRGFPGLVAP